MDSLLLLFFLNNLEKAELTTSSFLKPWSSDTPTLRSLPQDASILNSPGPGHQPPRGPRALLWLLWFSASLRLPSSRACTLFHRTFCPALCSPCFLTPPDWSSCPHACLQQSHQRFPPQRVCGPRILRRSSPADVSPLSLMGTSHLTRPNLNFVFALRVPFPN